MDQHEKSVFHKYHIWNEHIEAQKGFSKKDAKAYAMCESCGGAGCASCG